MTRPTARRVALACLLLLWAVPAAGAITPQAILKSLFRRRPKPPVVVADSTPPRWRPAPMRDVADSTLSISLAGTRPSVGLKLAPDPRQMRVRVDPDSGTLSYGLQAGEIPVAPVARAALAEYSRTLTRDNFSRQWRQTSRERLVALAQAQAATGQRRGQGLQIQVPLNLPRPVQGLLGPGGPALNVSGSERITISGTSNWTNRPTVLGLRNSLFPALDMRQDLDIRLEGQLSDRVKVNLLQSSFNQIPLQNRIAINYTGDEEDVVQALNLGNTSLSLPGTQYVSYSGRNEGLFGAKTALRVGPLDFTVLASKQEGRSERASYSGGGARETFEVWDADYIRNQYFFLDYPDQGGVPVDNNTIRVFVDDRIGGNNPNSRPGRAYLDPRLACPDSACRETTSVYGNFDELERFKDFNVIQPYGEFFKVIKLTRQVQDHHVLAVVYQDSLRGAIGGGIEDDSVTVMKLVKAPLSLLAADASGNFDLGRPLVRTRDLELRNFYNLGGTRIDPASLTMNIRRGTDEPPVTTYRPSPQVAIPYLELAGLDNLDETTGVPTPGHDDRVDKSFLPGTFGAFVDFDNGILFFPDPRPFAPRVAESQSPRISLFEERVDTLLNRRERFVYGPDTLGNAANARIYDKRDFNRLYDRRYAITGEFVAAGVRSNIRLNRTNIVEGSEVVSINGEALTRGRDYDIDYDLGEVRLKRQVGAADRLAIDFTYAPLFAQASKTLVGGAFTLQGRDRSLGGAFLYESKGAQELRPRLGEEPSRTVIGDLNTDLKFRPMWLTRLVDRLPGVRTTEASSFNVNAEVGMSFPNPNTRNEVFIDDMEGVRDAVGLTMGYERWRPASIPEVEDTPGNRQKVQDLRRNAELRWYTPPNAVQERDLKPRLSKGEGSENSRQVLALSVPQLPAGAVLGERFWTGLTYPLDAAGYDLTSAQFIELWVNDFRDFTRIRDAHVRLRIDIGRVSEDQMRAPGLLPDGGLEHEDINQDDQLNEGEDTGLDRAFNAQESVTLDLSTAGPGDPSGDNWSGPGSGYKFELDTRRWRSVNGTEGNGAATANPYPDTEDLDGNDVLDKDEAYVRYTIDLGDSTHPFLVTDVYKAFAQATDLPEGYRVGNANGWRLYRIPLADASRRTFGNLDLKFAKHVRVWLDSLVSADPPPPASTQELALPLVVLGGLEIVGSRWVAAGLDSLARASNTSLTLTSVNTVDNADFYVAPFDPGTTVSGNQALKRREQSLALQFERLASGGKVEAYRTFSLDEDYTRYDALRWYVTGFGAGANGLQYYLRFGADSTNYYEVRSFVRPVTTRDSINWGAEVQLRLTDISNLKLRTDYRAGQPDTFPGIAAGDTFILSGRPSFTRVRRITFGVRNPTGAPAPHGEVWLNEIRAHGVAKDRGLAQRVQANGRLANLMSYTFSWNGEEEDFLRLGQARGSGISLNQINASTKLDLHRFIEGTGIVLPLSLGYSRNSRQPRFSVGDDVRRTGEARERSSSLGETRSFAISYSRAWSERSNPFLRYTLGGITSNYSFTESFNRSPTSFDTTRSSGAGVAYSVGPRGLLALPVPATKARFYPLPERFYWNYGVSNNESRSYERTPDGLGRSLRARNKGRSARVDFGMDSRPFEFFRHHFDAVRNLSLAPELMERIGFINLGRVTSWRQNMDLQVPLKKGGWVSPTVGWNSSYNQNNGPEISQDLSVRAITNTQAINVALDFPLDRFAVARGVRAATDSGPRPVDWKRETLGRLGAVGISMSYGRRSAYSRLRGSPGLLYFMGLSDDPGLDPGGGRVQAAAGNQQDVGTDWHFQGSNRITLFGGAAVHNRFDFSQREGRVNGAPSRNNTLRFPDLQFDYGQLPVRMKLDTWFRNPRLETSFQRSTLTDYATGDRVTGRSSSSDWRPLLKFSGQLKNNTNTEFRVERRVTQRENLLFGKSTTTDRNTDLYLRLSRSYESGQKVSLLGMERTVKSSITMGLSGDYSARSGETIRQGVATPQLVTRTDRLQLNGNFSYSFSTNLSGQATLGFGQNRDLRDKSRPVVNRSLRLEVSAYFTF